jgi:hypothetical protein
VSELTEIVANFHEMRRALKENPERRAKARSAHLFIMFEPTWGMGGGALMFEEPDGETPSQPVPASEHYLNATYEIIEPANDCGHEGLREALERLLPEVRGAASYCVVCGRTNCSESCAVTKAEDILKKLRGE